MNATHEQAMQIREVIQQLHYRSSEDLLVEAQLNGDSTTVNAEHSKLEAMQKEEVEESYDASLISKSMVAYESNGARIENFRIETLDGRVVNCLSSKNRYKFCYDVMFTKNCENVRFYTLMKTLTGMELGGGVYPAVAEEGKCFAKEEKLTMVFEFRCGINPGTYFLNCGIGGNGGQSLHRIIDAMPFRVVPTKTKTHSFGTIDFSYVPYTSDLVTKAI